MLWVGLAIAGLGIGAIAGLAGLGLIATYRVTGVFNLAFGAIAMLAAYVEWWLVRQQGWPAGWAALVVVAVVGPAIGLCIELVVFRALRRRDAAPAELLAATLGTFVLLVGLAFAVWGGQARTDAPSLVPSRSFEVLDGVFVRSETVAGIVAVTAVGVALALVLRTGVGRTVRAVVESRALAELAGIDADRVSAIGWVVGATLASLAGVLLAPLLSLDPYGLTLVVLETMAVVVVAGATRPGIAVAAAVAIGVGQAELTQVHLRGAAGAAVEALSTNLFVVVLFLALLVIPRLGEPGGRGDAGTTARLAVRRELPTIRGWWIASVGVFVLPLFGSVEQIRIAQRAPALAVVLVSIVVLSGYGGQISLGQAGFAGLGAVLSAQLTRGGIVGLPPLPAIVAFPLGALLTVPVGVATSWLAIRRRGLFLALTTFAVGAVISRFVFAQPAFVAHLDIGPPAPFRSDDAFYAYELAGLAGALVLVRNLHRGRLGRQLVAVRDDEAGARAAGIDVARLKLVMFATSALLAAFGGTLLAAADRAFDTTAFDPIQSMLWFAAVVVFGVDSATGAVLGAGLLVGLDAAGPPGISTLVVGALAVFLGRLPGGLLYSLRRLAARVWRSLGEPPEPGAVRLSPAGRAMAERVRAAGARS